VFGGFPAYLNGVGKERSWVVRDLDAAVSVSFCFSSCSFLSFRFYVLSYMAHSDHDDAGMHGCNAYECKEAGWGMDGARGLSDKGKYERSRGCM
jgi:hypothetical protein